MATPEVIFEDIGSIRTGIDTQAALRLRTRNLPYYVHKWTRQKRHYELSDLNLPSTLYRRGEWPDWERPVVSIGGTRSPTVETFSLVATVVKSLADEGAIIISGGVAGVDLAAHLAAIDSESGSTIAVLANPVRYGTSGHEWHSTTFDDAVLRRGAFISEYTDYTEVFSYEYCERLLARDRIITGLSDCFLLFESNEDTGAVDTAQRALLQGKSVVAIESIGKTLRRGTEQLHRDWGVPLLSQRLLSPAEMIEKLKRSIFRLGTNVS